MNFAEALRRLSTPTDEQEVEAPEEDSTEQPSEDQTDSPDVPDAGDGEDEQSQDAVDATEGVESDEDTAEVSDDEASGEPEAGGDDQVFTLPDGTEVTLAELRDGYYRQADYTRKTQELADLRRNFEEESNRLKAESEKREQLRVRVRKDPVLRDLVDRYPEAESDILDDLTVAEGLLNDPSGSQTFAGEYELIAENPGIASRLKEAAESGNDKAQELLERQKLADNIQAIFVATDTATRAIAEELGVSGEQADEVARGLAELVGIPTGELNTPELQQQMVDGADTLFRLLFEKNGDQYEVRDKVLRNQFAMLNIGNEVAASEAEEVADRHNEAVDAALDSADPEPKMPDGDSPAPGRELPPKPRNFQEALARLSGH